MHLSLKTRRWTGAFAFAALLTLASVPVHALAPAHFWSQRFGDTGDQLGQGVAVDAAGNVYIAVAFTGTVNFGGGLLTSAGSQDVAIAKFTAAGAHVWSKRFGSGSNDDVRGIGVDASGNVFVTGYFSGTTDLGGGPLPTAGGSDIFLGKFDVNGNHVWSKRFGSTSSDFGYALAVDGLGNVLATGQFGGVVDFGGGNRVSNGGDDIYLIKYNSAGTHVWSNRYGSLGSDQGAAIAVDATNAPIITGYVESTVDFGGGPLNSNGADDPYLAKFDANGVHVFSKRFGGINYDFGYGVAADPSGNIVITGSFNGTIDFGGGNLVSTFPSDDMYLARFTSTGTHVWSKRLGGSNNDFGTAVAMDAAGNTILAGMFTGTVDFGGGNLVSAGGADNVIAKYDVSGAHVWSRRNGGTDFEQFCFVTTDALGNVFMTGRFPLTGTFGGTSLTSTSGNDVYLAKYGSGMEPPVISAIKDIGNDQGGKVKIRFNASGHDASGSPTPVLQYEAYRKDQAAPAAVAPDPAGLSPRQLLALGWTQVGSVAAHQEPAYGMDVPTIGDSTITLGQYRSTFYVRAATAGPGTFFDSPADSGYSLDNLAPAVPQNFVFNAGGLSWKKSTADDFNFFTVYGSNTDSFGAATVVDYSVAPSLDVTASPYVYYYVTATDFSGNEGKPAKVNTLSTVGGTPRNYVLSVSNYPNPFNPRTTVSHTVPSPGEVKVHIYDARGAMVKTLFEGHRVAGAYSVDWDGRADNGDAVASGLYFARIEHSSGTRTKKMVLLK